jgi:hypothetical protein
MYGDTQSALAVQAVLHAPVPHMYGLHMLVLGVMQLPLVLQVAVGVSVDPVQEDAAQAVPDAYFWQAPLPSHLPLVPQVALPVSVHWVAGDGA